MTIRKTLSFLCFSVVISFAASAMASNGSHIATSADKSKVGLALASQSNGAFIENKGQWDAGAGFMMSEPGLNFWVTSQGPVMDFQKVIPATSTSKQQVQGDVVRMTFVGAQPAAFTPQNKVDGYFNYFLGNDSSAWVTNVNRYAQVLSTELYQGIRVQYSTQNGSPRYDLVLKPGADATQIGMRVEGVSGAQVLANGDLQLQTSLGPIVETGMAAYQEDGASRTQVPCHMELDGNVVKFDLGTHNPAKEVIIDPLVYSTYFGVASDETYIRSIALDKSQNVVITGSNSAGGLPTTTGAYQVAAPTNISAYVAKLYPQLNKLVYCSYLGGVPTKTNESAPSEGNSVAVGQTTGEPVVVGFTESSVFPTTTNAFQKTDPNTTSGNCAFVTKLNATGTALVFSTYLGGNSAFYGSQGDDATCVKLDASENEFVLGEAASPNFPVTATAFQKVNHAILGGQNAFVAKLSATGSTLLFGTYFGGTGSLDLSNNTWVCENATSLDLDANDQPVFAGKTRSADLPLSSTAYQKTNYEFPNAATTYVAKLNATGSALVFSTYLGGTGNSHGGTLLSNTLWDGEGAGAVVNNNSDTVVVGATASDNFPVTAGSYQTTNKTVHTGGSTGFVSELNSTGSGLVFSTYLGGSTGEGFDAVKMYGSNILIAGASFSANYPVTTGAFQTSLSGTDNVVVTEMNSAGSSILYSTYLGGNADDVAYGLAINTSGLIYVGGFTTSSDFPTTSGALETIFEPTTRFVSEAGYVSALEIPATSIVLSNFTVAPNPAISGLDTSGRVFISNSSTSNITVTLTASGPVSIPSSVTIPAGATSYDFPIYVKAVAAKTTAVVNATYSGKTLTSTVLVDPAVLYSAATSNLNVTGGGSLTGYVLLQGEAGTGGVTVALSLVTSPTTAASDITIPATVTVPAGKTYATFTIKTKAVTSEVVADIVAKYGGVTVTSNSFAVLP